MSSNYLPIIPNVSRISFSGFPQQERLQELSQLGQVNHVEAALPESSMQERPGSLVEKKSFDLDSNSTDMLANQPVASSNSTQLLPRLDVIQETPESPVTSLTSRPFTTRRPETVENSPHPSDEFMRASDVQGVFAQTPMPKVTSSLNSWAANCNSTKHVTNAGNAILPKANADVNQTHSRGLSEPWESPKPMTVSYNRSHSINTNVTSAHRPARTGSLSHFRSASAQLPPPHQIPQSSQAKSDESFGDISAPENQPNSSELRLFKRPPKTFSQHNICPPTPPPKDSPPVPPNKDVLGTVRLSSPYKGLDYSPGSSRIDIPKGTSNEKKIKKGPPPPLNKDAFTSDGNVSSKKGTRQMPLIALNGQKDIFMPRVSAGPHQQTQSTIPPSVAPFPAPPDVAGHPDFPKISPRVPVLPSPKNAIYTLFNSDPYSPLSPSVNNIFTPTTDYNYTRNISALFPPNSPNRALVTQATLDKLIPKGISIREVIATYDSKTLHRMISFVVKETKGFKVLSETELDELSKEIPTLQKRIRELSFIFVKESRIREGAHALVKLHTQKRDKKAVKQANAVLSAANARIDGVTTELWHSTDRLSELRRKILEHFGAVLSIGMKKLDEGYKKLQNRIREVETVGEQRKRAEEEGKRMLERERVELRKREEEHVRIRGLLFPTSTANRPEVDAKEDNQENQSRLACLEEQLQNLSKELANMHVELDDAKVAMEEKDREIDELKSQLHEAEEITEKLVAETSEDEFAGVESDMENLLLELRRPSKRSSSCSSGSTSKSLVSDKKESVTIFKFPMPPRTKPNGNHDPKLSSRLKILQSNFSRYKSRIQELESNLCNTNNQAVTDTLQAALDESLLEVLDMGDQFDNTAPKSASLPAIPHRAEEENVKPAQPIGEKSGQRSLRNDYEVVVEKLRDLYMELPNWEISSENKSEGMLVSRPSTSDEFTLDLVFERLWSLLNMFYALNTHVAQLQSQFAFAQSQQAQMDNVIVTLTTEAAELRSLNSLLEGKAHRLSVSNTSWTVPDPDIREHFEKEMEAQEQAFFAKLDEKDLLVRQLEEELSLAKERLEILESVVHELDKMILERDGRVEALLLVSASYIPQGPELTKDIQADVSENDSPFDPLSSWDPTDAYDTGDQTDAMTIFRSYGRMSRLTIVPEDSDEEEDVPNVTLLPRTNGTTSQSIDIEALSSIDAVDKEYTELLSRLQKRFSDNSSKETRASFSLQEATREYSYLSHLSQLMESRRKSGIQVTDIISDAPSHH